MFLMHTVMAKQLGVAQYGIFSFAIAGAALISVVAPLGWPTVLMRFVAQYRQSGEWRLLRGVLLRSHQMTLVAAALAALIVWMISKSSLVKPDIAEGLAWAAVLLPFTAYVAVRRKAFQGFELFKSSIFPEDVGQPLLVLIGAMLFSVALAREALVVYLGASVVVAVSSIIWLVRCMPKQARRAKAEYRTREWMSIALPTLLGLSAQSLMNRSDVMLLGMLSSMESVGLYGAASRLASLNTFVLGAISTVIAPMLARAYHGGDVARFRLLVRRSMEWSAAGAMPMFIAMTFWPGPLLRLFGEEFARGATVLRILAGGQMINAATGPVGFALLMTGRERVFASVMGCGSILLVVTQIFVIPLWGAIGAAIASSVCVAGVNVVFLVIVMKRVATTAAAGATADTISE